MSEWVRDTGHGAETTVGMNDSESNAARASDAREAFEGGDRPAGYLTLVATRLAGHYWVIGGTPVLVPEAADAETFILEAAVGVAGEVTPLAVSVLEPGTAIHLIVWPDGSVTSAAGATMNRTLLRWLRPPGSLTVRATPQSIVSSPHPANSDLLSRVAGQVDGRDWEAVVAHAFERSTLNREAQALRVKPTEYVAALARARTVADGMAR